METILHSKILGDGKPFLILHGFLGMGDNWKTLGNKFAKNYQVHLIDQRNHGRSFHDDTFNYEILSKDLNDYIERYNLEKVILLGHSMGGKTVMNFAIKYPEKVSNLIVADISPKKYPAHHQDILTALNAVDFEKQKSRKEIENVLEEYIPQYGVRQFLMKNIYRKTKDTFDYRFNLKVLTDKYEEVTVGLDSNEVFEGNTLFLKGEKSGYITFEDNFIISKYFPNATIITVKNAGHWLHADNPTDFYTETVSFLDK